jgi:PAS domain S-box-containing protein
LVKEENYLKALMSFFDSAPMMMGIVEVLEDNIIHVFDNRRSAEFFNLDQTNIYGKFATEVGAPQEVVDDWIKYYKKAQETGKPVNFEYLHNGKHLGVVVSFIEMTSQNIPRFSYMAEDITLQKGAQERLQSQESFLETILDNIPDMIFVKDAKDLRFLQFNIAGEKLVGLSREEILGKNDYDLFPKELADYFTENDRIIFKRGEPVEFPQEPIETKLKGKRILHTKKIPLYDLQGEPTYLVGVSEDITEKLQAEENKHKMFQEKVARLEAEKSLAERDEFISIASHELKSPLSSLMLQAQMFKRKLQKDPKSMCLEDKVSTLIEFTEKELRRIDRLVNDMLDVSRIRSGKLTITKAKMELCKLVDDVLQKMEDQFNGAKISKPIVVKDSPEIFGEWDSMRIEQVVVNLLTNAIKYGDGSPITVELSKEKDNALITVSDKGRGIPKDKLDKIFLRFERAGERSDVSGLGLGLFISKQIVENHTGKIWAESDEGQGATFHVLLPLN